MWILRDLTGIVECLADCLAQVVGLFVRVVAALNRVQSSVITATRAAVTAVRVFVTTVVDLAEMVRELSTILSFAYRHLHLYTHRRNMSAADQEAATREIERLADEMRAALARHRRRAD